MTGNRSLASAWCCGVTLVVACGSAPPDEPPAPIPCPERMARDATGQCASILPETPCPPNTFGRIGERACQPIGPGACAAPFVNDGTDGWRCKPEAPDTCGWSEAPLFGATCTPVGWAACERDDPMSCLALTEPDLACDAPFPPAGITVTTDLSAAITAAQAGDILAIEGDHPAVTITKAITIVGPCAAQASIDGVRTSADVEVRGVTLTEMARVDARTLTLHDVLIDGATGAGVLVAGGIAEVHDSVIRDTALLPNGTFGRGISVESGQAIVERSLIEANREIGAYVGRVGSQLTLRDSIVRGTLPSGGGERGYGVVAADGADVHLERTALLGNRIHGLFLTGAATGTIRDVVAAFTTAGGSSGGLRVEQGASLDGERVALYQNFATGVLVDDKNSRAVLRDVIISGTRPDPPTGFAAGFAAVQEGTIEAERVVVEDVAVGATAYFDARITIDSAVFRGRAGSIGILSRGATITVARSAIVDQPAGAVVVDEAGVFRAESCRIIGGDVPGDDPSAGVAVTQGAFATLRTVSVEGLQGFGLLARDEGTELTIDDVLVNGTRAAGATVGFGLAASGGANVTAKRLRIQDSAGIGMSFAEGRLELFEAVVIGTTASSEINGAGAVIGGDASIASVAIVDNALAGLLLGDGTIEARDLLVTKTRPNASGVFGHGVIAQNSALSLERFDVVDNAASGLVFDGAGALVADGLVRNNPVGVHVQAGTTLVEAADLPALIAPLEAVFGPDALFIENSTRIGSGEIPIPSPADPHGE